MPAVTARQVLRMATSADHIRVDQAFASFDITTRPGYCAFLRAQAEAYLPVERGVDRAVCGAALEDWPARRRSHLLVSDMRALGLEVKYLSEIPVFDTKESVLGAVYVLEGSRLGAKVLARSVAAELPQSFLRTDNPGQWRKLIDFIDATLLSEAQLASATLAARTVFARFEAGAHHHRQDAIA